MRGIGPARSTGVALQGPRALRSQSLGCRALRNYQSSSKIAYFAAAQATSGSTYPRFRNRPIRPQAQAVPADAEQFVPPADDADALRISARRQNQISPKTVVLLLAAAAASIFLHRAGYTTWAKDYFYKTQLGKSGFPAAFSLIFLSEIGDKTFFIAALLAAKFGRWLSFTASVLSLSVMTIVSVSIGIMFSRVPEFMKSGLPIGEWGGAALLVYFGFRTLRVRTPRPLATAD